MRNGHYTLTFMLRTIRMAKYAARSHRQDSSVTSYQRAKRGNDYPAEALRLIVEDGDFGQAQLNSAFVLMEYFGYLRKTPMIHQTAA